MAIKFKPASLAELAKEICELYNSEKGFIAIDAYSGTVHLSEGGMARFFGPNEVIRSERKTDISYPYEFSAQYEGVKFYCITKKTDIFKEVR